MAEPSNPKPLTENPQNKRKPTTTSTPPPPKRPHKVPDEADIIVLSSDSEEDELPSDLEVYKELESYEIRNKVNLAEDKYHMEKFCFPYIRVGLGSKGAWKAKIRHLRNKFKNQNEQLVPPDQMEEFVLWKKIFARVPPPDA